MKRNEVCWRQPVLRCARCRRDFSPQAKALGGDVDAECSPAETRKIVAAATRNRSKQEASDDLKELAELDISAKRCLRIALVWHGRAAERLPELETLVAASAGDPRDKLADCLTYLPHNASRMKYADFRRAGFPLTTVLGESKMKQINRRMKGTEKFWRQGKESQLQRTCDHFSDTNPLDAYWRRRTTR